jgi:soluble P-type ATPase
MRKIAKVDKNQVEIVRDLRKAGCKVLHLHQLGNGCADTLVMYRGMLLLVEIKSEGGRMTKDEQVFYNEWQDCMVVVYSAEEALEALNRL